MLHFPSHLTTTVKGLLGVGLLSALLSCTVAVTLVTTGGEQRLRPEPLSPAPGPRVLLFALDGTGYDQLMQTIRSGRAPHLQALLGEEQPEGVFAHGYAAPNAISILPSTTMAAWSSVFTGEPPARTGVPGNEWFVRDTQQFFAPAPVSVSDTSDTLKMLTEGLVGNAIRTPTLYEKLQTSSHVSLAPVYRGATLFTATPPSAVIDAVTWFLKGVVTDSTVEQELYKGIDLFTHIAEDPLSMEVEYLSTVTDAAIGDILAAYQRLGVLQDTYVLLVADHGHTPVLDDDRHALGAEGDDEPPALLTQVGFRVRPFVLDPPEQEQDYQAVLAYQGAMAYLYLADRSTCPTKGERCDWRRPPRFTQDVLPVVRAFDQANRTGRGLPALRGALDLIFARPPRRPGQAAPPFRIFDGKKLVAISVYLARHSRPDLLQLAKRMEWLGVGPYGDRAGDVILLAKSGLERPIIDRFYFSGPYHSWHGSPTAQDSHIPLILARVGDDGKRLREIVRAVTGPSPSQLDVTPLVRALLANVRKAPTLLRIQHRVAPASQVQIIR
jgi:hypothetical protein